MYIAKQVDNSSSSSSSLNITEPLKTPRGWRADKAFAGRSVRWIIVTCCEILALRSLEGEHVTISHLLLGGFGKDNSVIDCHTIYKVLTPESVTKWNAEMPMPKNATNQVDQPWKIGLESVVKWIINGMERAPMAMNQTNLHSLR